MMEDDAAAFPELFGVVRDYAGGDNAHQVQALRVIAAAYLPMMEAPPMADARVVVEGVLAAEEERRRLGQAVGAEVGAWVHRLLGDIEQQAAAGALRQPDAYRGLGDALKALAPRQ